MALWTRSLVALAPILEKTSHVGAVNNHRPLAIDRREPVLDPGTSGVLMHLEGVCEFFHRVIAVDLDQPRIEKVAPHDFALKL